MSSFNCHRCGKICKSTGGLTNHLKSCISKIKNKSSKSDNNSSKKGILTSNKTKDVKKSINVTVNLNSEKKSKKSLCLNNYQCNDPFQQEFAEMHRIPSDYCSGAKTNYQIELEKFHNWQNQFD